MLLLSTSAFHPDKYSTVILCSIFLISMQISIGFFLHLRGNDTYNEGDDKQNCTTISSLHTYYLAGVEISQNWIQILIL